MWLKEAASQVHDFTIDFRHVHCLCLGFAVIRLDLQLRDKAQDRHEIEGIAWKPRMHSATVC